MRTMDHQEFLAMRRFPALDGLRALAATMVIFFHFAGPKWSALSGWVGVYIFFVLSGFLITTLLLREQDRTGRISLSGFYIRRVFRILPPYLVILGAIVAFVWLRGEFFDRMMPTALKYYLTFLNEFLPGRHLAPDNFFSGSWTLGIEEKFYLVWPFLLVLVGVAAVRRKLLLVSVALVVLLALVPVTTSGWAILSTPVDLYRSTLHYFILLVGCLFAIALHYRRTYALIRPLTHPLAALPVLVAFLALHTNMTELWRDTRNNQLLLAAYAVLVALLLVVLVTPGPLQWVLSTRPMRFVGERSYSLYLLQGPAHFIVVLAVPSLGRERFLSAFIVFLVSLAGADLIHRWVEQPMINLGKRLIARHTERKIARKAGEREPSKVGASV